MPANYCLFGAKFDKTVNSFLKLSKNSKFIRKKTFPKRHLFAFRDKERS